MKVLAINGSPRKDSNTLLVLGAMAEELKAQGIGMEIVDVGDQPIRDCNDCHYCVRSGSGRCAYGDDHVNETSEKMREANGIILGAPTYFGGIPGAAKAFLERAFRPSRGKLSYKVATAFSPVRRSGGVEATNQLFNFLRLNNCILAPTVYWTAVYGTAQGEVAQDDEGMQIVRLNARSMAWLIRLVEEGRGTCPPPELEKKIYTNFIR